MQRVLALIAAGVRHAWNYILVSTLRSLLCRATDADINKVIKLIFYKRNDSISARDIFLELCKAFDWVHSRILVRKHYYGVAGLGCDNRVLMV